MTRFDVLKMTWLFQADGALTLKLEGDLLGPWVEEVQQACAGPALLSRLGQLDLAAVSFVDAAGVRLLHELITQGMEITACSSFVAELLHAADS